MKLYFHFVARFGLLISALAIASEQGAMCSQFCIFELYGTTINAANGQSTLVRLNPTTGEGALVATISGQGIHSVTAIDFAPDGTLYGVAKDAKDQSVLIAIHCLTGWARIIGATNIKALPNATITDIAFNDSGVLWAYLDNGANDSVGTINLSTGAYTAVGATGINDQSNGLGFAADQTLFHGGNKNLSPLNLTTGAADSPGKALGFHAPAELNPHIVAIDRRPSNGSLYGNLSDQGNEVGASAENYLVTINTENATVSFLTQPVKRAPDNLAGIAFNPDAVDDLPQL